MTFIFLGEKSSTFVDFEWQIRRLGSIGSKYKVILEKINNVSRFFVKSKTYS